jgi:hypothetical protein
VSELIDARLSDDNVLAPATQSNQNDARARSIPRLYDSYIVFIYDAPASAAALGNAAYKLSASAAGAFQTPQADWQKNFLQRVK